MANGEKPQSAKSIKKEAENRRDEQKTSRSETEKEGNSEKGNERGEKEPDLPENLVTFLIK